MNNLRHRISLFLFQIHFHNFIVPFSFTDLFNKASFSRRLEICFCFDFATILVLTFHAYFLSRRLFNPHWEDSRCLCKLLKQSGNQVKRFMFQSIIAHLAIFVTVSVLNILRPISTLNLKGHVDRRPCQFDRNNRTHVALVVVEGIEIFRKSSWTIHDWSSINCPIVLNRSWAIARHPDLIATRLRKRSNVIFEILGHLIGQVILVALWRPSIDLVELQEDAGRWVVVAICVLSCRTTAKFFDVHETNCMVAAVVAWFLVWVGLFVFLKMKNLSLFRNHKNIIHHRPSKNSSRFFVHLSIDSWLFVANLICGTSSWGSSGMNGLNARPGSTPISDSSSCHLGCSASMVDSRAFIQIAKRAARAM